MMNVHADKIIANKFIGEFESNNINSTITNITNKLENKADKNLSNLTDIGKRKFFPSKTFLYINTNVNAPPPI